MNSGKIVAGILAGAAIGVALGILLAPAKGSETRKKFAKKGEEAMDDILKGTAGKVETLKDEAEELRTKLKSKAEGIKAAATTN